jgi:Mrp family chromosome partitioning ATPase
MARAKTDAPAALAEEFHRLAHELRLAYPSVRSLLVTAARAGEGTTTVAVNLARALAAQQPGRVLVVDANLRAPTLHRRFDVPLAGGLAGWNGNGDTPWQPTALGANLFVLTAGEHADDPRIRPLGFLAALVERLRGEFAFVVWDAPAVTLDPDALELATLVDGVLVVVEPYRTSAHSLSLTRDQLIRVKAFVVGAVMNRSGSSQ